MLYYTFENSDKIPMLGLGTWKSKPGEVYNAVKTAIQLGYRHIDCAHIYENEKEIGQAFTDVISAGLVRREDLWITSKLWNNSHRKTEILPALKHTLQNLQLDYLDLYLIHWPVILAAGVDYPRSGSDFISLEEIPLAETWEGMEGCFDLGLSKHIGVSNFSVKKLKDLISKSRLKPEVNQIELHPLLQQKEMKKYCDSENILLTAYSPLGSRDRHPSMKGENEPNLMENPVVLEIAKSHACSPAQVLIKWAIQRGTSVIPKSVNPGRQEQNFASLKIVLSDSEMNEIANLDRGFRFLDGGIWTPEGSPYSLQNLWD